MNRTARGTDARLYPLSLRCLELETSSSMLFRELLCRFGRNLGSSFHFFCAGTA